MDTIRSTDGENFNPRSHEGSDILRRSIKSLPFDFNPRSHEGSDKSPSSTDVTLFYFNPRSHEGSDILDGNYDNKGEIFQSTLPRGERRYIRNNRRYFRNFNPRSHEGSDLYSGPQEFRKIHFNPRSHEGSDNLVHNFNKYSDRISIHAPTRGATICRII